MQGTEWNRKLGDTCLWSPSLLHWYLYPQNGGYLSIPFMGCHQRWGASNEKGKPCPLG